MMLLLTVLMIHDADCSVRSEELRCFYCSIHVELLFVASVLTAFGVSLFLLLARFINLVVFAARC